MGKFTFLEMFTIMGTGVSGMFEITVISIIVAAIFHLVKAHGGVDAIIRLIRKGVKGPRGAQLGIGMMSLLVDCCTANNTVAIVMSGPIAKEIGEEYQISPKRTASHSGYFHLYRTGLNSIWSAAFDSGGAGFHFSYLLAAKSLLSYFDGRQRHYLYLDLA